MKGNICWKGMNSHCFPCQGILSESLFVCIQILDVVLPCCHIKVLLHLMCSGKVMSDHVYDPQFSLAFPPQSSDWFFSLVSVISSPALPLYWRVIGNPGTQAVKTSALSWGLASFQPWHGQQPCRHWQRKLRTVQQIDTNSFSTARETPLLPNKSFLERVLTQCSYNHGCFQTKKRCKYCQPLGTPKTESHS